MKAYLSNTTLFKNNFYFLQRLSGEIYSNFSIFRLCSTFSKAYYKTERTFKILNNYATKFFNKSTIFLNIGFPP